MKMQVVKTAFEMLDRDFPLLVAGDNLGMAEFRDQPDKMRFSSELLNTLGKAHNSRSFTPFILAEVEL